MPTITQCLAQASQLEHCCDDPLRETQALLSHCADMSLAQLYTWPEHELTATQYQQFCQWLQQRADGIPLAYLTGEKSFWTFTLAVERGVLVPRPETECLVDACLTYASASTGRLLDLGTGTGAIALAFASERPQWAVVAIDSNPQAVSLAQRNAHTLGLNNVQVLAGDWYSAVAAARFDIIVANPPYIDAAAPELAGDGVRHEPRSALVAAAAGMSDILHIIEHAGTHLAPLGYLLLEHGYDQGSATRNALTAAGFSAITTLCDYSGHERVSLGQAVAK